MGLITRASVALVAVSASVLALPSVAGAAPAAGKYSGATSESGPVTFIVGPDGKTVLDFTAQDGYNRACHFSGGVGGIKDFTVVIARMTVTKTGSFTGTQAQSNRPFKGTSVLKVLGHFTRSLAQGTVTVLGQTCGKGSPTPKASLYLETFTAART